MQIERYRSRSIPLRNLSWHRMVLGVLFAGLAALLSGATSDAAAQPINDDYALAVDITRLSHVAGGTYGATMETGEPLLPGSVQIQKSVWFKYVAPRKGFFTIILADQPYSSVNPYNLAIDVFRGTSFSASNRVAVGRAERIGNNYLIRLAVPTVQGGTYHIRVGSVLNFNQFTGTPFSLNFAQTGENGGTTVFNLRPTYGLAIAPVLDGRATSYLYERFRPVYVFVNTRINSLGAQLSTQLGTARLSSTLLSRRIGTVPGVVIGEVSFPDARRGLIGTWLYTVTAATRASTVVTKTFPVIVQRYDSSKPALVVTPAATTISAQYGKEGLLKLSVQSQSAETVRGCRISTGLLSTDDLPAADLRWRVPGGASGAAFTIPSFGTAQVLLYAKPNYIGDLREFRVYVVCHNAERSTWSGSDLTLSGTF